MRKIRSFLVAIVAVALLPVLQSCGSSESPESSSGSVSIIDDCWDYVDLIPVQKSMYGNWSMINEKGEIVYEDEFNGRPSVPFNGLFSIREKGGYSVYRIGGKKPELVDGLENLKFVGVLNDGLMPVTFPGKRISIVDKNGKVKFELGPVDGVEIVECDPIFTDGMLSIKTADEKWGFINTNGEVVVKPIYDYVSKFNNGMALVSSSEKYYNINKRGQKMFDFTDYDFLGPWIYGYMDVEQDGQFYILNKQGNATKLPSEIKFILDRNNSYIIFSNSDLKNFNRAADWMEQKEEGIAGIGGEILFSPKYNEIIFGNNDIFLAKKCFGDKSYIQINSKGDEIGNKIDYEFIYPVGRFGYMAKNGDTMVLLDDSFKKKNESEFYQFFIVVWKYTIVVSDYYEPSNDTNDMDDMDEYWIDIPAPEEIPPLVISTNDGLNPVSDLSREEDLLPKEENKEEKVYDEPEEMPYFPGGESALNKYVSNHLVYPENAKKNGVEGRVVVMLVVKKDGSVGQVKVAKGKDPELDKEAVRIAKSLPKFTPGKINGQPVNAWYILPIQFKLEK